MNPSPKHSFYKTKSKKAKSKKEVKEREKLTLEFTRGSDNVGTKKPLNTLYFPYAQVRSLTEIKFLIIRRVSHT